MLVINSLSTTKKNIRGRFGAKYGKSLNSRSRGRLAARTLAVSLAGVAAMSVPGAGASTMLASDHVAAELAATPVVAPPPPPAPTTFAPTIGALTSVFGERWGEMHNGLDIAGPIGTPIVAPTDGVVLEAGEASGFGYWIRLQQADGTIGVFGHIDQYLVTAGQQVKAGELIATMGNRGQSTGPHLHYEVWQADGTKIDPMGWLAAIGVFLGPLSA